MKNKILVITPISHIKNVEEKLNSIENSFLVLKPECNKEELQMHCDSYAIFTNPNKSNIYLGESNLKNFHKLKFICTASTGTVHIDKEYCLKKSIKILSLTEERSIISKISSTAEHAFALMMAGLRNIPQSNNNVYKEEWDYEPYIGRQINCLTIGVIGYGRLGTFFANYCDAFGANVLVYDPYKTVNHPKIIQVDNLEIIASKSDVISLHVHVTEETLKMVNNKFLSNCKSSINIINTSRGEIIDEIALINFLSKNIHSKYCTDVLSSEINGILNNPIFKYAKDNDSQFVITPHIGGMTKEAQEMAFNHAAYLLKRAILIQK